MCRKQPAWRMLAFAWFTHLPHHLERCPLPRHAAACPQQPCHTQPTPRSAPPGASPLRPRKAAGKNSRLRRPLFKVSYKNRSSPAPRHRSRSPKPDVPRRGHGHLPHELDKAIAQDLRPGDKALSKAACLAPSHRLLKVRTSCRDRVEKAVFAGPCSRRAMFFEWRSFCLGRGLTGAGRGGTGGLCGLCGRTAAAWPPHEKTAAPQDGACRGRQACRRRAPPSRPDGLRWASGRGLKTMGKNCRLRRSLFKVSYVFCTWTGGL